MKNPEIESRARAFWIMCQDIKRRVYTVPSRLYEKSKIAVRNLNKTEKTIKCKTCGKKVYRQLHTLKEKMYCSQTCLGEDRKDPTKIGSKYYQRTGWSEQQKNNFLKNGPTLNR